MATFAETHILEPQAPPRNRRRLFTWEWGALGLGLVSAGLVIAPLLHLGYMALSGEQAPWTHLLRYTLPPAALDTVLLLAGVACLTGLIGIGTAWLVTLYQFPGRRLAAWLLPLPLALPTYIMAYTYAEILNPFGPAAALQRAVLGRLIYLPDIRTMPGAIFVFSLVLYPYVYLAARAMFLTQSACMTEVARTLGASRFKLFRTIALPLARPALAIGLSLALLETLNDIGAVEYLGVRTLTLSIYVTWLNGGNLSGAAQLACLLLILIIALIGLEQFGRRHRRFSRSARRSTLLSPLPLHGTQALLCMAACLTPVVLGLLAPLAFLIHETVSRHLVQQTGLTLWQPALTTLWLASTASVLTVSLGYALAIASRLRLTPLMMSLKTIAGLGYAIPGSVLALAMLAPLVFIDGLVSSLSRTLHGPALGLVLTGSAAGVIIAYVIRFLPIATGSISAGLTRISPRVDDAARALGETPVVMARDVLTPLIRPAVGAAALLVFVDCIKELPATLLLRPLNFETLATSLYSASSRGVFEEGALAALLIVAISLLPVLWLTHDLEHGFSDISTRSSSGLR